MGGISESYTDDKTLSTLTPLSLRKRVLFATITVVLAWLLVEILLHILTLTGLLPYLATVTPPCYTQETVQFKLDAHGSPIFVNGNKVYRQIGIPPRPLALDADGFRPIDAARLHQTGHKIAFFGDSYTEGLQVADSETFPRLLESHHQKQGRSTICFNFGVGGTGTYHQYLRYLTVAEQTHFDDVVLCFLPQNDVLNNHEKLGELFALPQVPYLTIRDGDFVEVHGDIDTALINRRLNRIRSTVGYSFVATAFYRLYTRLKTDAQQRKSDIWRHRNSWLAVYGPPPNKDWEAAWNITEEAIRRFADAVKKRSSRFTLLIVADSLQIADSTVLDASVVAECDFAYPNRRLTQFCETNDITCLDSLPFFLERKPALNPPYFSWQHDGHYSRVGHQTMVEFLASTGRFKTDGL